MTSWATSTNLLVKYPELAVLSAVSAKPFLAPWVDIKYSKTDKPSLKLDTIGFSISERQETWIGYGQTYMIQADAVPIKAELHAMTGLYDKGLGHGLGGRIAFRSGLDLIYETNGGVRYALSYDHRSHIGIYKENPGMETIQFAVSLPLK